MGTDSQDHLVSDLAVPPGELLIETLEKLNLTQAELSRRMGRPAQAINEIVRGTKEITAETAIQLERVLGVPAHIWLGLEAEYQHAKARLEDRARLQAEAELASRFPCADLVKLGWMRKATNATERVSHLLEYFGVGSLHVLREAAASYRVSRSYMAQPEALAAWLRKGDVEAQKISTRPFSEQRLRGFLPELRGMTVKTSDGFEQRIKAGLADCGVALVLLPHLRKTHAHGATRWLTSDKALIQLSLRGKKADIFWFTLFHEIGHLLLHGRRDVFIEQDDRGKSLAEDEADAFARDELIAPDAFREFVRASPRPSRSEVVRFGQKQGVAPGIVVGRLQHEGCVPHSELNELRVTLEWA
jgi:HTH-type transcriptional regulator / antitoxin HigA